MLNSLTHFILRNTQLPWFFFQDARAIPGRSASGILPSDAFKKTIASYDV